MTDYPERKQVADAANTVAAKISVAQREAVERMHNKHENEANN
jgi:hypothetical protein